MRDSNKIIDLREYVQDREQFKQACVQANLQVRASKKANVDGERIRVVSAWNQEYLVNKLKNYDE